MQQPDEAAQVQRARAGDREAFRALVERHSRAVFRTAYRITGNEQDAEDMVQETFLRAYRQLKNFDARAQFGTWLMRIAMNRSLDLLRSRERRKESQVEETEHGPLAVAEDPSPERMTYSREVSRRVTAAMARLSPAEKAAFVMRHFEGRPIEEIARAIAKPNGATRHCIFRAVEKLRAALAPVVSSEPERYEA